MNYIPGQLKGAMVGYFAENIQPSVNRLVQDAGFDPTIEWSITVLGCHNYGSSPRPSRNVFRLGAIRDSTRHIDFSLKPSVGRHSFDIRLCVPRSLNFISVQNAIANAINLHNQRVVAPAAKTAVPASTDHDAGETKEVKPESKTDAAPAKAAELLMGGINRLEGLRTGLDAVLNLARDARASAEMRAEIQERHDEAARIARPLMQALDQAETLMRQHASRKDALVDDLAAARARVAALEKSLEEASADLAAAQDAFDRAAAAAEGPGKAWDEAAAELLESERLEAERLKVINEQPGIAGLLAALEALNGGK